MREKSRLRSVLFGFELGDRGKIMCRKLLHEEVERKAINRELGFICDMLNDHIEPRYYYQRVDDTIEYMYKRGKLFYDPQGLLSLIGKQGSELYAIAMTKMEHYHDYLVDRIMEYKHLQQVSAKQVE